MQYFIENLKRSIEKELSKNDINLIKIEGIENPKIYSEICKYFKSESLKSSGPDFTAKLSLEKYDEFTEVNNEEWNLELDYLAKNLCVDFDAAMTKWRNSISEDTDKKYRLILLMGTECVQDKGGLADFCTINIYTMIEALGKNQKYYSYFNNFVNEETIGEKEKDIEKVVNKIIDGIFSIYPIDLIKLSDLAEYVEKKAFETGNEFVVEIFKAISKIWGLPLLVNDHSKITFNSLKGTKKLDIIAKAEKFISRREYRTKAPKIDKIEKQIDKYVAENFIYDEDGIDINELKTTLLDFVRGKNYEENKEKLLNIDFDIINSIFKVKVDNGKKKINKKDKVTILTGSPLEVFLKMILQSINEYQLENEKRNPEEIEIEINKIILGNCVDKSEQENYYKKICMEIGGIVEFINQEEYKLENNTLKIKYKNDIDIFNRKNSSIAKELLTSTKTISELSKIEITINLIEGESVTQHLYRWAFNSTSAWLSTFKLIEEVLDSKENDEEYEIPFMWINDNLKNLVIAESEDEFFYKLEESSFISNFKIQENFKENYEITKRLELLKLAFKEMIFELREIGFYNSINNVNSEIYNFIKRYVELIDFVIANKENFNSIEKDKLYLIYNLFNISDSENHGIKTKEYNYAIVPAIHPVMIEKLIAQKNFLKDGFKDILCSLTHCEVNNTILNHKIDKIIQLSTITNGVDVLTGKTKEIMAEKIIGNYAIYIGKEEKIDIIDFSYNGEVNFDEEVNIGDMLINSPESEIFAENIIDYLRIFSVKIDGLKIAVVNPSDLQYVVSGINTAVNFKEFNDININLKLTIIRDKDKTNGIEYLRYRLDNKLSEKDNVNISTFVLNKDFGKIDTIEEIQEDIKKQDIIFIHDILKSVGVEYDKVNNSSKPSLDEAKFPMVFPPQPLSKTSNKRKINITQKQFEVAYKHTQLGVTINHSQFEEVEYRIAKELGITRINRELIRKVHDISNWVVCMDEAIDKEIISEDINGKVVGFTTGKGNYGELNVTVSANNEVLEDIKYKLKKRLKEKFSSWRENEDILNEIAEFCINKAHELDGGKILKSLNNDDYAIHNLLSYIITLQYLEIPEKNEDSYIKILLNLDSHMHWFENITLDDEKNKSRPDLLLIDVRKDKNNESEELIIDATVIECKMGEEDQEKRRKAKKQVENGIKILSRIWDNTKGASKRYWYNQLYRALIFSRINIDENSAEYINMMGKIEDVLEGNFKINWNGRIFTYWINSKENIKEEEIEIQELEDITKDIKIIECGQVDIKRMILPEERRNMELEYEEENIPKIIPMEMDDVVEIKEIEKVIEESILKKEVERIVEETKDIELEYGKLDLAKEKEILVREEAAFEKEPEEVIIDDIEEVAPSDEYKLENVRVLIGEDENSKKDIYWEFGNKKLNNRHLFISGTSGSGKTYCIQCLLYELTKQGVPAIIFDYTEGFRKDKLDPIFTELLGEKIKEHVVKIKKFNINPFKKQKINISGYESLEEDVDVAARIAESFANVYKFKEQQHSAVYTSTKEGLKEHGEFMNFEYLAEKLEEKNTSVSKSVLSKIQQFLDMNVFDTSSDFSWKNIVESRGDVFIIQLVGYTKEIQVMLTELILWDIWNYAKNSGSEDNPFVVVLDEAQNISHKEKTPSGYILTEGRKFGVSGWYATQFVKAQMTDDEVGRLQQAAQKIYFAPPDKEMMDVAKAIDNSSTDAARAWGTKLQRLGKGECVSIGQMQNKEGNLVKYRPSKIKVTSLGERKNGNKGY